VPSSVDPVGFLRSESRYIVGLMVSSSVERPAIKWPGIFEDIPLFVNYPYLLPCGLAASVTFMGEPLFTYCYRLVNESSDKGPSYHVFWGVTVALGRARFVFFQRKLTYTLLFPKKNLLPQVLFLKSHNVEVS
jgi:hypothetical protein